MRAITFEVIARTVFGVVEPARIERLRTAISALIAMDWALLAPKPLRIPFLRKRRQVDALLHEEIDRRRGRPGDDVLSVLLSARDEDGSPMTDDELRDELMTVLAAGHETTATGLAWAFDLLSRHPDAVTRIRSGDDDYLDAAVKEVLRVRPVIDACERRLAEPRTVLGFALPAGIRVYPAIALAQLRPQSYPDPYAFRPERFLNGGAPEPYTWLPFGGGIRRCIGPAFAQLEMRTVIRTVLETTEIEPARHHPERATLRGVTLIPARGAPVRARKLAL
jgi:cytochrome P450